jgi:hypothetical protein
MIFHCARPMLANSPFIFGRVATEPARRFAVAGTALMALTALYETRSYIATDPLQTI